jgi:Ca-activated chloride channel family protein
MRSLVLSLALVLALAAPAAAQDRGAPVVGGGSFGDAPLLQPGTYHDTILPGEYLYYAFKLAAGQSLHVTLTHPDIANQDVRHLGVLGLSAYIHTPARTRSTDTDSAELTFADDETEPLVITGPTAEADPDDESSGEYLGPGIYYLALHPFAGAQDTANAEIPFTFTAEIQGAAQPNATPTPTATPRATATAAPAKEADDAGPAPAVAAIGGIGGLLLGVAAGIARRR